MLEPLLGALMIFGLRIGDVSIGTMRVMFLVNGRRLPATLLAFAEAGIWIVAIGRVFATIDDNPWNMLAYAAGFAAGTLVGMTVEQYLAFGQVIVRAITRADNVQMRELLASEGFGVTEFRGTGVSGEVSELMTVIPRRRRAALLKLIHTLDPKAFVVVEPVSQSLGGYMSPAAGGGK
jgi:uncharacterized protein YebE (UPF0316 family)